MQPPPLPSHPIKSSRRVWLVRAAIAAVLAPAFVPRPARAATTEELSWTDPARQRTLPLLMRWPAGDAPCAVVLFSHGLGGNRNGGAGWGSAWQEAGFAVLHLQHPGSDTEVLRGGERGFRSAASAEQLVARAADVRFVINELTRRQRDGAAPWQRLRLDALGLAGHSFGAGTTTAVAGQRFPVVSDLADPRPRAFIAFSPAPGRSTRLSLKEQFGGITRPMLVMSGTLDGDPLDGGRDPNRISGDYRASVFDGLPAGARALLWLEGADHMSFGGGRPGEGDRDARFFARLLGGRNERPAAALEPQHHALIRRTSTLWWRAYLLGDADAAAALRGTGSGSVRAALAAGDRWLID